ncbi:hypothetical protein Verru16b_03080 [Lacunisphaera limnophila]|uniref:Uncharacterized protein n=1 Tax=Lacunisphaera limnophila TaxID=1838286 RepID=A0A1D8AYM0_9BACT|nr:hypothetical protein Verru16b_03080 [Lacunisphaera limnophila]
MVSAYDSRTGNGRLAFVFGSPLVLPFTNLHEHPVSPVRLGP